jgi:hypothetical protein
MQLVVRSGKASVMKFALWLKRWEKLPEISTYRYCGETMFWFKRPSERWRSCYYESSWTKTKIIGVDVKDKTQLSGRFYFMTLIKK